MSIESVTRACYARALSPEAVSLPSPKKTHSLTLTQWEGLLAQLPAENDEAELCGPLSRLHAERGLIERDSRGAPSNRQLGYHCRSADRVELSEAQLSIRADYSALFGEKDN